MIAAVQEQLYSHPNVWFHAVCLLWYTLPLVPWTCSFTQMDFPVFAPAFSLCSNIKSCSQSDCQSLSGELRNMASSFLCFTLLFITIYTADGFMEYTVIRCVFNSTELNDIEFILSLYYNKIEYARFSSSVGKFVGFTQFGVYNADYWNNDPTEMAKWRPVKETYCQPSIALDYQTVLTQSPPPTVRLHSTAPPSGHHPAMLVCSVYNFYPKQIKVSWLRDGHEVSSDVTSTEEMADGDWYYQTHSHLEYTPRSGEKISCVVEHASLKEPLIIDWDSSSQSSMSESERNKFAIGASGLILGLILSLAGFIYYRRKARGGILVPTN